MDTQVSFEDTAKDLIYGDADNEQNLKALIFAHIYGIKILSLLTQVQAKDNF